MQVKYLDDIRTICRDTDQRLWKAYHQKKGDSLTYGQSSRLIFPNYQRKRVEVLRVSEQEARFAFVETLQGGTFYYSVETPTQEVYQLTGSKQLSAQTDLTLYNVSSQRICNVEFKSKGASPKAKNHFSINKDIEKLLHEPVAGLWFHLLERVNKSTIPNLLLVIANEIAVVHRKYMASILAQHIVIHLCVLNQSFSLHRHFLKTSDLALSPSLIWPPRASLDVSRGKLKGVNGLGEWDLYQ